MTISSSDVGLPSERAQRIRLVVLDVDGVLTDGTLYYGPSGEVMKGFNVKDGMGIKMLRAAGIDLALLSNGRPVGVVKARARDLGIKTVYIGREAKLGVFHSWLDELGLAASEVAYIGDDVNDLPVLQEAGLSACPEDAVEAVKATVDLILDTQGGKGAVREFAERLIAARKEAP